MAALQLGRRFRVGRQTGGEEGPRVVVAMVDPDLEEAQAWLTPEEAFALSAELWNAACAVSVRCHGVSKCELCGAFDGTHTASCLSLPRLPVPPR